ncbi:MAG TPA: DUF72 domain-containing protein [Polyangiaceae bacterium]|jgi:uncharacterized protein YecE (DUF72 family)|nr:DUF72 domain-containing protein [Polyangiaceae bacterium]
MPAWIGTSGFSYKEWKKNFYPGDLPDARFLSYYATRLNGVEIDSTFYRMPTAKSLDTWRDATPEQFRFAIKAPQKITHRERLVVPSESLAFLLEVLPRLGDRLGVVLYQLPPNFKRDMGRLESFLTTLPKAPRSAFEFRHLSWFDDDTYRLLEKHGVALCINDNDEFECPVKITARHTYIRLRRDGYTPEQRAVWKDRIGALSREGIDVLAFIKHKDNPDAPLIALDFADGLAPVNAARPAPL